jgi:formyltetrahydrofolate hydrolase
MDWSIAYSTVRKRVVILVSKYDQCRVDLQYRRKSRELKFHLGDRVLLNGQRTIVFR